MASNGLFTTKVTPSKSSFSRVRANREYLISQYVAGELNTYTSFTPFSVLADTYMPDYQKGPDGQYIEYNTDKKIPGTGVRSLFNRAGAVMLDSADAKSTAGHLRISNNVPLLDSKENREAIRSASKCTIKDLVRASEQGLLGREIYSYADFMYCKYLGKVSNNYLVTLRRFPLPVDDYISTMGKDSSTRKDKTVRSKNAQPIGCLVTWMGTPGTDMNDILKYDFSMPFKEQQANWESNGISADKNGGILNAVANVFDSKYREQYTAGMAGGSMQSYFEKIGFHQGSNPYSVSEFSSFQDSTKVYGPVDSIKSVYKRSGEGLQMAQSFTITFDYELRSYNGINGKQAFLDLLSNILAVTYSTGTFWGGGYRGGGAHQNNIFANLEIFKCKGGFTDFVEAFSNDVSTLSKAAGDKIAANGGLIQTIKAALNSIGGMLIGGALNSLGRPDKQAVNSLLSPAPVGFWHVTIGNPFHPIMSMGNMILKKTTIEHYGPLGLDDFPTGIRVKCELERGKPRDSRDIEKMYMHGNERIYYSMGPKIFDMYTHAKEMNSSDTSIMTMHGKMLNGDEISNESASVLQKRDSTINSAMLNKTKNVLQKYFGETDVYSIYVASAEQEYGAGSKTKVSGGSGRSSDKNN